MKKFFTAAITAVIVTVLLSVSAYAGWASESRARQRAYSQQKRIVHGTMCGQLTQGEAHHFSAEQKRNRHLAFRTRADGRITRSEQARLHRAQDHASRHIYRHKHNYMSVW